MHNTRKFASDNAHFCVCIFLSLPINIILVYIYKIIYRRERKEEEGPPRGADTIPTTPFIQH